MPKVGVYLPKRERSYTFLSSLAFISDRTGVSKNSIISTLLTKASKQRLLDTAWKIRKELKDGKSRAIKVRPIRRTQA